MVKFYTEVSKRARNSIEYNLGKLIQKYGYAETRLVVNKLFQGMREQKHLEKQIKEAEEKLLKLKKIKNLKKNT